MHLLLRVEVVERPEVECVAHKSSCIMADLRHRQVSSQCFQIDTGSQDLFVENGPEFDTEFCPLLRHAAADQHFGSKLVEPLKDVLWS